LLLFLQKNKNFLFLKEKKQKHFNIWLCIAILQPFRHLGRAAEICRFDGTTDYAGHVAVTTDAASVGNTVRVDVTLRFEAITSFWLHVHYLVEEISVWRDGTLLRLDANTRYMLGGHVVRQQWDDFRATQGGLQAYRIEGKRPAEFRRQHPRFAKFWDLQTFGRDWLHDCALASPDRRPDLDFRHLPQSGAVRSPFTLAFYWVRFLHPGAQAAQIFLPGFKADKLAGIALTPVADQGGILWRAGLHHPYLSAAPASSATARITGDGYLRLLTFELHGSAGSAGGSLHLAGCSGTVSP
jgi:hypothetical protein